jgi:hypothetical protein
LVGFKCSSLYFAVSLGFIRTHVVVVAFCLNFAAIAKGIQFQVCEAPTLVGSEACRLESLRKLPVLCDGVQIETFCGIEKHALETYYRIPGKVCSLECLL